MPPFTVGRSGVAFHIIYPQHWRAGVAPWHVTLHIQGHEQWRAEEVTVNEEQMPEILVGGLGVHATQTFCYELSHRVDNRKKKIIMSTSNALTILVVPFAVDEDQDEGLF